MRPALVLLLLCAACGPNVTITGDGSSTTLVRPVPGTKAVRLEVPAKLTLVVGEPASLKLTGEANLFPYIDNTVTSGELSIGVVPGATLAPTRAMEFVLTAPSFRGLTAASPGDIIAPALTTTDLLIKVESRGNIHLARLDANTLDTRLSSSGEVRIDEGKVGEQTIALRSTGDYVATGLESASTTVNVSSGGSAWVWATGRLTVTISGTGDVHYVGTPQLITHITGTGTVTPVPQ
ncbi:MAG: head GIN domain-containing protein [Archangium sp.]|nr:head GIN domain-containing protein [Archangium sp.]